MQVRAFTEGANSVAIYGNYSVLTSNKKISGGATDKHQLVHGHLTDFLIIAFHKKVLLRKVAGLRQLPLFQ